MVPKQRVMCLAPGRATPGMTLARPITDREGSVLLSPRTTLDLAMLERLIRRGVDAISVLVPDHRDEATISEELRAVERRVETIFRGPGSAARTQLRDAVLHFRIETTR